MKKSIQIDKLPIKTKELIQESPAGNLEPESPITPY